MSGCTWERVASYIENGHKYLSTYGSSFVETKASSEVASKSTEYATIYEHNTEYDNTTIQKQVTEETRKQASINNYEKNYERYGDAIYETSTSGEFGSNTNFNNDFSSFFNFDRPFLVRGDAWSDTVSSGLFAFSNTSGDPHYLVGFRAVVCPI